MTAPAGQVESMTVEELRQALRALEGENAELRLAQQSLDATRASEAWFRSVFTNVITAIAATDRSGRVTHFNDAFLTLLDYDAEAMQRMNFSDFTDPDDLKSEMVFIEEILAGKREHYRLTKRYFARGRRVLWVDLSVAVIRDAKGEVTHFVAVIDDITELWRARAELETLLREVHHRVKNNLQVISSLLSLQAAQSTDEGVRAALAESGARVQTMARVHERLYRSARLSSLELGEHLSDLAKLVFQGHQRPGLELDCEVDSMEVDLELATPLGLILNELVSNACKHGFRGRQAGRVSVRLHREGERLELVVADDGLGLPPGFELNQSASLGLRIVRSLVEQMRGTLSLRQARGTSISVVVGKKVRDMKTEKILLVEDEGVVALDIEQRLTQLGYVVVGIADTGAAALTLARAEQPDLVLMDIRIRGDLDGIDLARELASRHELPVVFLTGNADEATLRRALEAEPYGYVLKPFELRTLEAVIATALFRFRAERRQQNMRRWLGDTMRSLPDAVIATDLELRVTFLNRAAEHLLKRSLAETLRRPLGEVLTDPKVLEAVQAVASQGEQPPSEVERFCLELDGRPYDVSIAPISSETNVSGVVVLLH